LLVSLWRALVPQPELPEPAPRHCRELVHRMHCGGAAALRAHRPYLAISHRIIVLSRRARGKDLSGTEAGTRSVMWGGVARKPPG